MATDIDRIDKNQFISGYEGLNTALKFGERHRLDYIFTSNEVKISRETRIGKLLLGDLS